MHGEAFNLAQVALVRAASQPAPPGGALLVRAALATLCLEAHLEALPREVGALLGFAPAGALRALVVGRAWRALRQQIGVGRGGRDGGLLRRQVQAGLGDAHGDVERLALEDGAAGSRHRQVTLRRGGARGVHGQHGARHRRRQRQEVGLGLRRGERQEGDEGDEGEREGGGGGADHGGCGGAVIVGRGGEDRRRGAVL